ncbi:MAG: class I SAM-dependent methyltransferase [Chloroflexota bacterium]
MQPSTIQKLLDLNHQFYQTFALPFSSTRLRLQPGVRKLIPCLLEARAILDLGCGNGELALSLFQAGFQGGYCGLDFSAALLEIANQRLLSEDEIHSRNVILKQTDISRESWVVGLELLTFDWVVAFAVLHHIPGEETRLRLLRQVADILRRGGGSGGFIQSNWQFLNSARYRGRVVEWGQIGLSRDEVEEGDYLLDWREGGRGLRYVHHFSEGELAALAVQAGFRVVESFYSDGREGNLANYQVWELSR